jgi:hypothetical protein
LKIYPAEACGFTIRRLQFIIWEMLFARFPFVFFSILLIFADTNFAQSAGNSAVKLMKYTQPAPDKRAKFYKVLDKILPKRGLKKENICDETDPVQLRLLNEYGAMFVIGEGVVPPPYCIFTTNEAVEKFQQGIFKAGATIDETYIELQTVAMQKYLAAREEAKKKNLDITPRGGSEAARRSFADTVRLWKSRVDPACEHWLKEGRLTEAQVENLKKIPLKEQVGAVLELEKQGIYFNTFFNYSILYSVAAPGASQHLSMLALDVKQFQDENVRKILARYGWFRTVQNDAPHFTYLGRKESELEKFGLKKVETDDGEFWIPDVD